MKTIFGEEHFLDNTMCEIFYEKNKEIDDYIFDNIYATSTKIGITVDKDKLRRWLILSGQLEQIDKSDLIDIAIKKKFDEKDHRIAVLERALKLACEPRDDWGGKEYDEPYTNYYDYFIDQAEKELKDGDID